MEASYDLGLLRTIIKSASSVSDTMRKMTHDIAKIDLQETYRVAKDLIGAQGFNVEDLEPPNFNNIRKAVVQSFKLSVLIAISVALTSLLDPLEAITRYPDSSNSSFDETNLYIVNFESLCKVIDHILAESKVLTLENQT